MQSSLKKSLYLGLAVLSLGAVASVSTNASAKSKAKVTSDVNLQTATESRNVAATGRNALYSKPGTVKGAKLVASKKTMKKLANSEKSADLFWAYRVAVTNKGAVYYKVVSMNGKYRGYIYGGTNAQTFAKGIVSTETTKQATMPTRTAGFKLANVSKNTLWTAPKNTQHKAKTVSMYNVSDTDTFTVTDAATKTRENTLYYKVTDEQHPSVSGWIYAGKGYQGTSTTKFGGLTTKTAEAAATNDNSVKVIYRDGSQISTATFVTTDKDAKAGKAVANDTNVAGDSLAAFAKTNVPAGYQLTTDPVSTTNATFGNNLYVDVQATSTSKVSLNIESVDNKLATVTSPLTTGSLNASDASVTMSSEAVAALTGQKGQSISGNLSTIAGGISTSAIDGKQTYFDKYGTAYHYQFTFQPAEFTSDNRNANFGDTLKASFKATLVAKAAPSTPSVDNSWIA